MYQLVRDKFIRRLILVYFLIGILILPFYQHSFRQDAISYISIAEKYYNGEWENAVNGVWGPLISWLLMPVIHFNINPIIGIKILQILTGGFLLIGMISIANQLNIFDDFKIFFGITGVWVINYYIFLTDTPDLLFATILLFLILKFLTDYKNWMKLSIYSGVFGAFLYFAKPFGYPVFIFLFTVLIILTTKFYYKKDKIKPLLTLVIGFGIFFILTSPWIYLLSQKYNRLTFSTGGEYNFNIIGPDYRGVHTPRIGILYSPVNATATSYWEDPTFLEIKSWNPFNSISNMNYLIEIIISNLVKLTILIIRFSPFMLFFLFTKGTAEILKNQKLIILLSALVVYIFGLSLLFIEQRFVIILHVVIILITGVLYLKKMKYHKLFNRYRLLFSYIMILSIIIQPVYSLISHLNDGNEIYDISVELVKSSNISGNIASFSENPLADDWGNSLTISYLANLKYFGEIQQNLTEERMYDELKKFDINYFFVWNMRPNLNKNNFLKIYSREFYNSYNFFGLKIPKTLVVYRIN